MAGRGPQRGRTPQPPPIAQPQPSRPISNLPDSGRGSPDSPGQQGNRTNRAQAQSTYAQQRKYTETRTITEEVTETSGILEEYFEQNLRMLTLADCVLTLTGTELTIQWTAPDGKPGERVEDLNTYVGNIDGELIWGSGATGFSESCDSIRVEGTFLHASCSRGGEIPEYVQSSLDLNLHFIYSPTRGFEPAVPDPVFTEFLASSRWMNYTIVTQPDIGAFLQNPALQNVIANVARRSIEQVMSQMQFVMEQMIKQALEIIKHRSEAHISREMASLIHLATAAAAYTGMGQLTMMQLEQRRAFNRFAPYIGAGMINERGEGPDGGDRLNGRGAGPGVERRR